MEQKCRRIASLPRTFDWLLASSHTLTFSFSLSKLSSCVPSTPLAVNSGAYCSMFMATNHRHTCWLFHSKMGRLCHWLLLLLGTGSSSNVWQDTRDETQTEWGSGEKLEETLIKAESRLGGEKKTTGQREHHLGDSKKEVNEKGQTHLRGGKGESVRVPREGQIRDMTHHAGAAHRRADALEAREKGHLYFKPMHACLLKIVQTEQEAGVQRAQFITTLAQERVGMFSGALHIFSPDLFYLWWSGTVNCCWTQIEVSPCLSPPPLLCLALAPQTRGRAGRKAWRWSSLTEKLLPARPPGHHTTPCWKTAINISIKIYLL